MDVKTRDTASELKTVLNEAVRLADSLKDPLLCAKLQEVMDYLPLKQAKPTKH